MINYNSKVKIFHRTKVMRRMLSDERVNVNKEK